MCKVSSFKWPRAQDLSRKFRSGFFQSPPEDDSKSYFHLRMKIASQILLTRAVLPVCFCLFSIIACAQEPGLRRPSVKYHQINTDTIRIIYPIGHDSTARRIAQLTTMMARQRPLSTGAPLRKIDILLQNATDIPNGYVGLGPWRSEFYLTPPQNSFDIGSLPWHDILSIHEFRHVQQLSATRKGISALFYYLFGEEAYSGAVHLAVPDWYIEGDAVVSETVLTPQGRGRMPAFTNAFREKVSDGEYWRYDRVRNGSLKEFIPTEYPLGYLLVNYGRERYGQQFWDSVLIEAAQYKGLFYSFSGALKRRTGDNTSEFYRKAMDFYRNAWYDVPYPAESRLAGARYRYRDSSYPSFSDSSIYQMIQYFDRIPAIYKNTGGKLEKVVTPGFQTEPVFSIGRGRICWTELRRHPRWSREDYSVIVVYDLMTNSRRTVTQNSSYFMPALSPDGKRIAAVRGNDFQTNTLHILSAETGELIHEVSIPEKYFYTHPQWSPDGRFIITAARLPDGRMTLIAHDLIADDIIELMDPVAAPMGRPHVTDEWVYFAMTSGNVDQIFRVHRSARYFEQVTFDGVSKYEPCIDPVSGDLFCTQYSLYGKSLISIDVDNTETRLVRNRNDLLNNPVLLGNERDILDTPQEGTFPSSKYPLLARPIRLHSWSLFSDDPVFGIELLSENTLNTIQWRSGWEYNQNSGYHGPYTELIFGLWYPQIVAGYSATRIDRIEQNQEFVWWQHVTNAGLRIPYSGYHGPYAQFGSLSTRFNHISTTGDADFRFDYLSHTLQFTNALRQAYQHAESRFSQHITGRILHSVDTTTAKQFYTGGEFNVPSPIRNHLFKLEFDYRHELTTNTLRFSDIFEYARGYEPLDGDDVWRMGLSYQLPVAYPDFGIAGLIYFRRIRVAPFFDIMRSNGLNYRSAGGELYFDIRVFNVEPTSFGIRWAKRLDLDRGNEFSFIIPTGL